MTTYERLHWFWCPCFPGRVVFLFSLGTKVRLIRWIIFFCMEIRWPHTDIVLIDRLYIIFLNSDIFVLKVYFGFVEHKYCILRHFKTDLKKDGVSKTILANIFLLSSIKQNMSKLKRVKDWELIPLLKSVLRCDVMRNFN